MRLCALAATLSLAAAGPAAADAILFSNGPQVNLPFGGYQGAHASRVQGELGLASLAFGGGSGGLGVATDSVVVDDFVVPGPWSWRVTGVTTFALDEFFPASSGTVKLWTSPPWQAGAVAWRSGTATLASDVLAYRVPSDDPTSFFWPIRSYVWASQFTLPPGHYWLSWQPALVWITPSTGFQPRVAPVTVPGQATTGDGRWAEETCDLFGCSPWVWHDALDASAVTPQGFPFVIRGRPAAIRKGELGGPGGPDLLFRNVNAASSDFNRNKVWFMDGVMRAGEAFITPDPAGPEWKIVGSDDFDTAGAPWNGPDGRADLVLRDESTGAVEFWLMDGSDRVGSPLPLGGIASPSPDWQLAATADFNGDGRPDLLWRDLVTQELLVWMMADTLYRASVVPFPSRAVDANWTVIGAQDYNDDGASDFLWYNSTTGRIVTWYMDAALRRISGQFVTPAQAGDHNWKVVASADYSRDAVPATPPLGSADIVWRNATSGRTVVWHLDFDSTRVFGQFTSPDANTEALDWVVAGPR